MSSSSERLHSLLSGNDVEIIAQKLLGSHLITSINGIETSGVIVETEAYKAPEDKGSHAYGNKKTKRTETLFEDPGTSYVYLCYGIHHLFNVVTGPNGTAHAVLIRAIEPLNGIDKMIERRKAKGATKNLTNGPGKLTQALGLTTKWNGLQLLDSNTPIEVSLPDEYLKKRDIVCGPRVGIGYAQECAHWPWRFRIRNNAWTSLPHKCSYDQIS